MIRFYGPNDYLDANPTDFSASVRAADSTQEYVDALHSQRRTSFSAAPGFSLDIAFRYTTPDLWDVNFSLWEWFLMQHMNAFTFFHPPRIVYPEGDEENEGESRQVSEIYRQLKLQDLNFQFSYGRFVCFQYLIMAGGMESADETTYGNGMSLPDIWPVNYYEGVQFYLNDSLLNNSSWSDFSITYNDQGAQKIYFSIDSMDYLTETGPNHLRLRVPNYTLEGDLYMSSWRMGIPNPTYQISATEANSFSLTNERKSIQYPMQMLFDSNYKPVVRQAVPEKIALPVCIYDFAGGIALEL